MVHDKFVPAWLGIFNISSFYYLLDFTPPHFAWPPTMDFQERRLVFDYIICPEWGSAGKELATNTIAYHILLESKNPDASKGTHILPVNRQIVCYGNKLSSESYEQLDKENPGMFYVPVVEDPPIVLHGHISYRIISIFFSALNMSMFLLSSVL